MQFGEIDRDKTSPAYEQIADTVRRAITSGELRCGDRLPTEAKLADHFGVARMTVRNGLRQLRLEGIVVPAPGRGLRVARTPNPSAGVTLVTEAEAIGREMSLLAEEIKAAKTLHDPVALASLMAILADIASTQARIVATLACAMRARHSPRSRP